ncbi:MAG: ligand-binding sensor domain-containing protein [Nostoc sp.]
MSSKDYQLDLPVPVGGEDLPIPVADAAPQQEQPSDKAFLEWGNLVSQRHVRHLAFDPTQENLWLATGGGILHWKLELNRFVRYASEHGLPGNSVLAVTVDGAGQVWAAHEQFGIYYLKNDTWRPYRILGEVKVSCLTLDSTGKLWAGTSSGIYSINTPDRKPAIELPPAGFPPRAMSIVDENDIWLCNAQGVYNYKNANWVRTSDSVQPDVLTLARQGENVWLGTFRGLVRIDLSTNKLHKIDTTYPGEVTALAPHPQGVWAACGGQVGLATETGWTPLTEKRFNAIITSLLAGRDDQVWIGTHDGLLRGENKQILLHLTDNPPDVIGLASREKSPPTFSSLVQALSVQQFAGRSILWIGTALGLFRYDLFTESWRRYGQLASQDIRAIITSQDQETVWVASWSSGLHSLKQQNELQTAPNISEPILTLTAGSDRYWAIGLDGLYQYKNSAWVQVISNKVLPVRGWLQAIAQAVTDHVWLGTSAGLLLYKTDTKGLTPITGNLGSADVRSLQAINRDESEQVWVGTSQGLYIGNVDNWEPIPELENRVITALVWDKNNGSLWVGTDRGLFCLLSQGNAWKMVNEFNIHNSGLGANRVTALTISTGEDKETKLWVGTPCGLSCYTY